MIDIETELYDELARLVLLKAPDAYVSSEHVISPPRFPAVCIEQVLSSEMGAYRDSSGGENVDSVTWTVNVYSNSESNAKQECKSILAIIDERMRLRNMRCATARPIDNAADPTIYRMVARYTGSVGKDGTMYWR